MANKLSDSQKEDVFRLLLNGGVLVVALLIVIFIVSFFPSRPMIEIKHTGKLELPRMEKLGEAAGDKTTRFGQGFFRGIKKNVFKKEVVNE